MRNLLGIWHWLLFMFVNLISSLRCLFLGSVADDFRGDYIAALKEWRSNLFSCSLKNLHRTVYPSLEPKWATCNLLEIICTATTLAVALLASNAGEKRRGHSTH